MLNRNINQITSKIQSQQTIFSVLAKNEKTLVQHRWSAQFTKEFLVSTILEWTNGIAKLHTHKTVLVEVQLTSGSDPTYTTLPCIEPTESFRTLGVHLSPSGSSKGALKVLTEIALDYATKITGSRLSRQEQLMSFIQYLIPKLRYQPPLLSLSKADCDKLMVPILKALLPKLHVNCNTARSIIFGPKEQGGLALQTFTNYKEPINCDFSWDTFDQAIEQVSYQT